MICAILVKLSRISSLWVDPDGITVFCPDVPLDVPYSHECWQTWTIFHRRDIDLDDIRMMWDNYMLSWQRFPLINLNTGCIFHWRMIKFHCNMLLAKINNFENSLFLNIRELLYNYISSKYITSSITWSHKDAKIHKISSLKSMILISIR